MNNYKKLAQASGLRVFPISIYQDGGKWQKKPLVSDWVRAATTNVEAFDWSRANGFGIAMGGGLYAVDLDDYKPGCAADEWLDAHGLTRKTRTHKTISGGRHLFYRTPAGFEGLRNTNGSLAAGLDTRGAGGFIAFGEGYELLNDAAPATMSLAAAEAIKAQNDQASGDVLLRELGAVKDRDNMLERLNSALLSKPALAKRWSGSKDRLKDRSLSAMDMSAAQLLTKAGFAEEEVVELLLYHFEHGRARKMNNGGDRAAMRCAARARQDKEDREERARKALKRREMADELRASLRKVYCNGR